MLPYDFQIEGIKHVIKHKYSILADSMGLGKSFQALFAALSTNSKILIVCPAFLKLNWEGEIKKSYRYELFIEVIKTKYQAVNACEEASVFIVSYGMLGHCENIFKYVQVVIFDEAHRLKNMDTRQSKLAHKLVKENLPTRVMLLTGTPIKNHVAEFYSLLLMCSYNPARVGTKFSDYFPSYYSFVSFFCYLGHKKVKGRVVTVINGTKNLDDLHKLLSGIYLRRVVDDVIDLPDLTKKHVIMDKAFNDDELRVAWKKFKEKPLHPHIMKAKANCALEKSIFTAEYVYNLAREEDSILILTCHVMAAKSIYNKLHERKKLCGLIYGEIKTEERHRICEAFQKKHIQIIVATIGSIQEGVNLNRGRHVVFNDMSWVPTENAQSVARCRRIGTVKPVMVHEIYGSKIDYLIQKIVNGKNKIITTFLE
jgi:SNF2 family DNA or RNA helicase